MGGLAGGGDVPRPLVRQSRRGGVVPILPIAGRCLAGPATSDELTLRPRELASSWEIVSRRLDNVRGERADPDDSIV